MNKTLLKLENVTMQFGGVVAVNDLSLEVNEGGDRFSDRTERRGKDNGFQCGDRRL